MGKNDHPSSARVRRATHLERAAVIRDRKRVRRLRGEIHAAMALAKRIAAHSSGPQPTVGPYRAPDVKDHSGWQVLDKDEACVAHATSRDKARLLARRATAGEIQITLGPVRRDREDVMLTLGWERVEEDMAPDGRGLPVEEKYRRVVT
jgi:hypothetical protein